MADPGERSGNPKTSARSVGGEGVAVAKRGEEGTTIFEMGRFREIAFRFLTF